MSTTAIATLLNLYESDWLVLWTKCIRLAGEHYSSSSGSRNLNFSIDCKATG